MMPVAPSILSLPPSVQSWPEYHYYIITQYNHSFLNWPVRFRLNPASHYGCTHAGREEKQGERENQPLAPAGGGSLLGLFWPTGWGRGREGLRTCSSSHSSSSPTCASSSSSHRALTGCGLSGVILMGRRFPGSSGPGDFSRLGVGGRPDGLCGGLSAGSTKRKYHDVWLSWV